MQRLAYVLLILGVLGTLVSGVGYAPLLRFIPGIPLTALALFSTLGCLSILLVRLQRLEQAVSQTQAHSRTLHAQFQDASRRLETVRPSSYFRKPWHGLPSIPACTGNWVKRSVDPGVTPRRCHIYGLALWPMMSRSLCS